MAERGITGGGDDQPDSIEYTPGDSADSPSMVGALSPDAIADLLRPGEGPAPDADLAGDTGGWTVVGTVDDDLDDEDDADESDADDDFEEEDDN